MASVYEEMGEELESLGEMSEGEDGEEADMSESDELDGEFAMLAEKLGFEGERAKTFKQAIERCLALRDEGAYAPPAEGELDDEDL